MNIDQISKRFKTFAEMEYKGSSELYEYLSLQIAEDDEVLELCLHAKEGQPIPNLFLGAVHYLLLTGNEHVLKEYYPSIVKQPKEFNESYNDFKNFCQQYREQIISLLKVKLVQTNEVRRCAYLYPSFSYIYRKVEKPLALIEIGTSAGLQLLWDKYRYTYNTNESFGNSESEVFIQSEIKGEIIPNFTQASPPVTNRFGLDLHVNDVSNLEDTLWLNSLIWPEHKERRNLFNKAVSCVNKNKNELNLIEGDGVELLPQIIEQIPQDSIICVFHTHVANQIPVEIKHKLLNQVRSIGNQRDIFHLYNNIWDRELHLDYFINGIEHNELIGETDGHGRWFKWYL